MILHVATPNIKRRDEKQEKYEKKKREQTDDSRRCVTSVVFPRRSFLSAIHTMKSHSLHKSVLKKELSKLAEGKCSRKVNLFFLKVLHVLSCVVKDTVLSNVQKVLVVAHC